MPAQRDDATQTTLNKLLEENSLSHDTLLYREASRDVLAPTKTPGVFRLAANPSPSESVIDVYGQGHLTQAEQAGPGLAFAQSERPNWQETMEMRAIRQGKGASSDRVEVWVRLGDVLGQGGLIYPVESVTVERVWYFTLPAASVNVHELKPGS
jgi:hypothetical protein